MNHFKIAIMIAALSSWGAADLYSAQVPGAFVDLGYGTRAMGMGGAFTAVSDDTSAILWNPAGLSQLETEEATMMNGTQKHIIPCQFAAFGHRLASGAILAFGAALSGDDLMYEKTMTASYSQALSYKYVSRKHPRTVKTSIGVTYKLRSADFGNNSILEDNTDRIQGSAEGHCVDLGILYHWKKTEYIGLSVHDLLGELTWDSNTGGSYIENVPRVLVLGLGYRKPNNINIACDLESPARVRLGIEKLFAGHLTLRAGYNQRMESDPSGEYSVGVGLTRLEMGYFTFSLDMAYRYERIGDTTRFAITLDF
jgi:hypothetical protein